MHRSEPESRQNLITRADPNIPLLSGFDLKSPPQPKTPPSSPTVILNPAQPAPKPQSRAARNLKAEQTKTSKQARPVRNLKTSQSAISAVSYRNACLQVHRSEPESRQNLITRADPNIPLLSGFDLKSPPQPKTPPSSRP